MTATSIFHCTTDLCGRYFSPSTGHGVALSSSDVMTAIIWAHQGFRIDQPFNQAKFVLLLVLGRILFLGLQGSPFGIYTYSTVIQYTIPKLEGYD